MYNSVTTRTDAREERGCHTALREIYYHWAGATWVIEGDISDCFGSLNHELLLTTLSEKIHDGRFIKLISNLLDAGYLEDWRYNQTLSGVPQGSVASPILSNILLDKLDSFVTTVLIAQYTRGEKRKPNHEYDRLAWRVCQLRKQGQKEAAQKIKAHMQRLPSRDTRDPDYRRLRYTRYADDFGLACIGPKSEAEEIKGRLTTFLREELKLTLSEKNLDHPRPKWSRKISGIRNRHPPERYQANKGQKRTKEAKYQWESRIARPSHGTDGKRSSLSKRRESYPQS
jgi:retron-type reverse transcriptase